MDLEGKVAAPQLSYVGGAQPCSTVFFFLPSMPLFSHPAVPSPLGTCLPPKILPFFVTQ